MGRKAKGTAKAGLAMAEPQIETPTSERLRRSQGYFIQSGQTRRARRFVMMDDNLSRLRLRNVLTHEQYVALQRYALHWYAGGMAGTIASADLERIRSINPGLLGGLAQAESLLTHKRIYHEARVAIGPEAAWVADMVACRDHPLQDVGAMLGYSTYRGREYAGKRLVEAGDKLWDVWLKLDKRAHRV